MTDLANDLAGVFNDTVFHSPALAFTGAGKKVATFGDETAYRCRVVRKQRTVRSTAKGSDIAVSRAQVWLASTDVLPIKFGDRLRFNDGVLPEGNTTTQILSIETWPDDEGRKWTKVFL